METRFSLHVLGECDEFAPTTDWLADRDLVQTDDLAAADLVVVSLDHPDRLADREVERLLASAPLARWIVCVSTWCESIGRNRTEYPRGTIVPARLATVRIEAELAVLRGERPPLPLTASRDEAWAFDHEPAASITGPRATVRIDSPDRRLAETWAAILDDAGFEIVDGDADVTLFDGDPDSRVPDSGERIVVVRTMPTAGEVPKLAPNGVLVEAIRAAAERRPVAPA